MPDVSHYAENASNSFVIPDICVRIRNMLDDDNSAIEDIAHIVSLDPSLASKLLKLANSPLFRFRSQVDSITKAVNVIGGEALYNLVMAETASSAFEHLSTDDIDLKRFWMQSIYAGLIAKHLAKLSRVRGSERFFLLGLLHNLGELVVANQAPAEAKRCVEISEKVSPWQLQKKVLGFTYVDLSALVLQSWHFPPQLHFAIGQIHDESKALGSKEVAIMYTAVRAAAALVHKDLYTVDDLVNPLVLNSVGLDTEYLTDAINFSHLEANKMLAIMRPQFA